MGMLARLSLEEACVVSKPVLQREEGFESKLKRAATYDEDDFETESESATTEGFVFPPTDHLASRPASNLAPKGLENARYPARYFFEWPFVSVLDPVLHTVQNVYERDPFLLTVSCIEHNGRHYCALSAANDRPLSISAGSPVMGFTFCLDLISGERARTVLGTGCCER
ncbi:hypothetical protein BU17DRAFT_71576 [Hysterangium stoloniferum]|nr:hypothetical protein BU17DRAFT_71576 [Hysterangium stoloniferum]